MNREDMRPPGEAEDRADAELDTVLFAADDRILDVIRRSLDLDAGLAQIIGDPPREDAAGTNKPADTGKNPAGTSARSGAPGPDVPSPGPHQLPLAPSQPGVGGITQEAPAPAAAEDPGAAPERGLAAGSEHGDRHQGSGRTGPLWLVIPAAVLAGAGMAFMSTAALAVSQPLVIGQVALAALTAAGITCTLAGRRILRLLVSAMAKILDRILAAISRIPLAFHLLDSSPGRYRWLAFLAAVPAIFVSMLTTFPTPGVSRMSMQPTMADQPATATVPTGRSAITAYVKFSPYESRLSESAKDSIREWIITIPDNGSAYFTIAGYTADYATWSANVTLSLKRAWAVADFLEGNGVKETQLSVAALGAKVPTDRTDSVMISAEG